MIANNINNLEIVANNDVNTITNAKNADIEPMDIENINTADIENDKADMDNDKSKDTIMSDYNDDNSAISNNNSPQTISGNDDAEASDLGENSTEDTPSPLFYGRKTNDPTKVKTSKGHRPIKNLQWTIHMWIKMPQANQILMSSTLVMGKYMNSSLRVNQTLKTKRVLRRTKY